MKNLFIIAIILWATHATAGEGSGVNAGDHADELQDTAWFLSANRSITICIDASATFPNRKELKNHIAAAYEKWVDYVDSKIACGVMSKNDRQASKLSFKERCDGSEDLKFYFGTSAPEVEQYKAKLSNPLAFAQKTQAMVTDFWSKGFVWFAESATYPNDAGTAPTVIDWSAPNELEGMLIHEIGHIFGNPHHSGTIMREDIAIKLINRRRLAADAHIAVPVDPFLTRIDNYKELLLCPANYVGKTSAYAFKTFTGETASGDVDIEILKDDKSDHPILRLRTKSQTQDLVMNVKWSINPSTLVMYSNRRASVFRSYVAMIPVGTNILNLSYCHRDFGPQILEGSLVTPDGRTILIMLVRNIDEDYPMVLKVVDAKGFGSIRFNLK